MAKQIKSRAQKPKMSLHKKSTELHQTQYFCLSLRHCQSGWLIVDCETSEKLSFISKLQSLCSMTWQEIQSSHHHGLGSEKINQSAIKTRLPSCITEDTTILALRFHDKAPMVGYREGPIFHVIWFDRSYKLYDH